MTKIEWCDSTLNLEMGCNGCELWSPERKSCYAGIMTERYKGQNLGFPAKFEEPELYLYRLLELLKWSDLTGTRRLRKPWLDGLPRFVFLDDMGDTFSESLPADWLVRTDLYDDDVGRKLHWETPLQIMADTPHFYLLLTKRPARMVKLTEQHGPLPDNFMAMTTVTSRANERRIEWLRRVNCKWKGLSVEPMLGPLRMGFLTRTDIDWVIVGNESGRDRRDWDLRWPSELARECVAADVPFFTKQIVVKDGRKLPFDQFPDPLRLRQMPKVMEVTA